MHRTTLAALAVALATGAAVAGPTFGQEADEAPDSPRRHIAGHVVSFEHGFLTIRVRATGDHLRAHVTDRTRIRCRWLPAPDAGTAQRPRPTPTPRPAPEPRPKPQPRPADPAPRPAPGDPDPAPRPVPADPGADPGTPQPTRPKPVEPRPDDDPRPPCGPRLLQRGTPVLRARLALIARGAVWTRVTLLVRRPSEAYRPR